jgi:hypothetical protein
VNQATSWCICRHFSASVAADNLVGHEDAHAHGNEYEYEYEYAWSECPV